MITSILNILRFLFFFVLSCVGGDQKVDANKHDVLAAAAASVTAPPPVWKAKRSLAGKRLHRRKKTMSENFLKTKQPVEPSSCVGPWDRCHAAEQGNQLTSKPPLLISNNVSAHKFLPPSYPFVEEATFDISTPVYNFAKFPFFGRIIAERFIMIEVLAQSDHAVVVRAVDGLDETVVIIKSQLGTSSNVTNEANVYYAAQQRDLALWFPQVRFSDQVDGREVLITACMGASTFEIWLHHSRRLPNAAVGMIGWNALLRLEALHQCGRLHCDVKPQHIVCHPQEANVFYLIEFTQSQAYVDSQSGVHFEQGWQSEYVGCPLFAPRAAHQLLRQCRRDDLEALGYTLLYLMKGYLPWQSVKCDEEVLWRQWGIAKSDIDLDRLCDRAPEPLLNYCRYVFQMGFYDRPDYQYLLDELYALSHW